MRFPLNKRQLIRGCDAHNRAGLGCAADYVADNNHLYAPVAGSLTSSYGYQGGMWLQLKGDNGFNCSFAHLSKYIARFWRVNEGDYIAVTGNSGQLTTGPHLHLEVYDKGKRIDPEEHFSKMKPLIYKQQGHSALYFPLGNTLISFATDYDLYLKEFGDAQITDLTPGEFFKFKVASTVHITKK